MQLLQTFAEKAIICFVHERLNEKLRRGGDDMARNSSERLEELQYKREQARLGGGLKRQEAIRTSGRGTARDRINLLLDEGSFIEIDSFATHRSADNGMFLHHTLGDGVVAGHGTVNGRRIYCFAQDFSVHGGSMGEIRRSSSSSRRDAVS